MRWAMEMFENSFDLMPASFVFVLICLSNCTDGIVGRFFFKGLPWFFRGGGPPHPEIPDAIADFLSYYFFSGRNFVKRRNRIDERECAHAQTPSAQLVAVRVMVHAFQLANGWYAKSRVGFARPRALRVLRILSRNLQCLRVRAQWIIICAANDVFVYAFRGSIRDPPPSVHSPREKKNAKLSRNRCKRRHALGNSLGSVRPLIKSEKKRALINN